MRIVINPFDQDSIKNAIAQVKQYRKDFEAKEKEFVRRLGELGVSVAGVGFATADYDGVNDVVVKLEQRGAHVTVIASGTTVGFIEFGTGIRNPEWDNSGMEYTPPKHGTYGKGHGKRSHGWFFKPNGSEGAAQHTYGNIPAEAMRTARDVMVERVAQIAREVWG
jgi:hypothetical protein